MPFRSGLQGGNTVSEIGNEPVAKVEQYLNDLGVAYRKLSSETWLVEDEARGLPKMVISQSDPVVVIRASVMPVPSKEGEALFKKLLQLNFTDFLHGAYAIDGDQIVAVDTLELKNMNKDELSASIEAMAIALSQNYPLLSKFAEGEAGSATEKEE